MSLSVTTLYAKIGQLVVENEMLRNEIQRLELEKKTGAGDAKAASTTKRASNK